MKFTLLEIVQDILSAIDGDEVNSIDDTFESQQVASVVRATYINIINNRNWPHLKKLVKLTNSGSLSLPTHLKVVDDIKELVYINYNCLDTSAQTKRNYKTMRWLEPDAFLRRQNAFNSDSSNVDVIQDPTGVELLIKNDKAPEYFTSFDDDYLVFDSYKSAVEDTLQSAHVQAVAYVNPTWVHTDDAIPDLPDEAFTLLIEDSKSRCSMELRQTANQKAEQAAHKNQQWLSRKAWKVKGGVKYPNYGRKGAKSIKDKTFEDN